MANSINYTGRLVIRGPQDYTFGMTGNGMAKLQLLLAEQHQQRNDKAPQKYRDGSKPATAYVNTTTSWHRLTLLGDIALEIAADERFCNGSLVDVTEASYTEEEAWQTKDGVLRAGRPETIGDKKGDIDIYVGANGNEFVGREPKAIWDGDDASVPTLQRNGGGGGGREYREDEGL